MEAVIKVKKRAHQSLFDFERNLLNRLAKKASLRCAIVDNFVPVLSAFLAGLINPLILICILMKQQLLLIDYSCLRLSSREIHFGELLTNGKTL